MKFRSLFAGEIFYVRFNNIYPFFSPNFVESILGVNSDIATAIGTVCSHHQYPPYHTHMHTLTSHIHTYTHTTHLPATYKHSHTHTHTHTCHLQTHTHHFFYKTHIHVYTHTHFLAVWSGKCLCIIYTLLFLVAIFPMALCVKIP